MTVTLIGTNDAPTITSAVTSGAVTELADGASREYTEMLTAAGTIAFKDVDLADAHVVVVTPAGPGYRGTLSASVATNSLGIGSGSVSWSYAVRDGDIDDLAAGETLTQSYTVTIDDGHGGTVARVITITINGAADTNNAPVIGATVVSGAVSEDGVTSASGAIAFTDVDLNDVHTVTAVAVEAGYLGTFTTGLGDDTTGDGSGAASWSFSVDNGTLQFLAAGETRTQSYTVTLDDGRGGTASEVVTITIAGTNDAPTVSAEVTGGGAEGSGVATVNLLDFAADVDTGASLHVENVVWNEVPAGFPAGFTLNGNALEVDTDSLAYNGMALGSVFATHFTYDVVDEHGARVTQHATITITGTNDAPTVSAEVTGGGAEGSGVATVNLLDFAADVDTGASLHVENVVWDEVPAGFPAGFALNGNAIDVDTDSLAYNGMALGSVFATHFTFDVVDEHGARVTQHATITITGTNDAPTVSAEVTGGGAEGSGVATVNLLDFAADVDTGASLHVENVVWDEVPAGFPAGFALNGNAIDVNTDSLAYNGMALGSVFATHFTFDVVDEHGARVTQHATITITGTNDAPTVSAEVTGGGAEGSGVTSVNPLDFAADVDTGASLHVENVVWDEVPAGFPVGFTLNGKAIEVDTDSLAYNGMAQGETFTTHFTYDVVDEHGARVTQHATVTVTGTNDGPVALGETGATSEDVAFTVSTAALLSNDTDVDGDTLSISAVGGAAHGAVALSGGNVVFTPHANYSGQASFSYTVSDGHGGSASATVALDVAPDADTPLLNATASVQPVAIGGQSVVNTTTDNAQRSPAIAALADGGYVIVWNSFSQANHFDIMAQRFDASGARVGAEISVNTFTAGSQEVPTVTALAGGDYVVAWASNGQDGSGSGVYAQRFDASGAAAGGEFRINSFTAGFQIEVSVAGLADGGFIATWTSADQSDPSGGILRNVMRRMARRSVRSFTSTRLRRTISASRWRLACPMAGSS